ncbi:MAG: 30S ribosomal protein S30 [Caldilinea sp. CFX5]|nr:30S ribosomal protein S30 [Caldilinea sp. CFX5]
MQDFTYEFFTEVQNLGDALHERLQTEAETRLRKLQQGHTDLIGAAVSIEQPAKAETAFLYRARVVVYIRPENLAATAQESDPLVALKRALSQVERQVREQRERLRQRSRQPAPVGFTDPEEEEAPR